jgi:hypothetical protein
MNRNPSEREALDAVLEDFRTEIHTSFPARVLAYDAAKQTVDVRPGIQREYPSDDPRVPLKTEPLPDLMAIPVQWPRAGGFAITFPIQVGDWVEVQCAEQSLLVWRQKGDVGSPPGVSCPHGLNGACAKPGWYPDKQKLSSVDTSNMVIRSEDNGVRIVIAGNMVTIGDTTGAQFLALANKVDQALTKIQTAFDDHTHPVPALGTSSAPTAVPGSIPIATLASTAATMVKGK